MVKSVLDSVPLYYFSLFRAQLSVIKELERARRVFFCGGVGGGEREEVKKELSWVSWDKVLGSFGRGVNIGGLKELNWGLFAKWWWRFHNESEVLWKEVIVSIYGKERDLMGGESRIRGSVWGNIVKVGKDLDNAGISFSESFGKQVGDGKDTWF